MSFETRTKVISSIATTVIMLLLLLLLYVLGLYSQVPPPAPKKMILIEFSPDAYGGGGGGGGGGGNSNYLGRGDGISVPNSGIPSSGESINLATQLTDDAPALGTGAKSDQPQGNTSAVAEAKPEPGATYRPGRSGGGIGPGSGGGTGGGRGTGTGTGTVSGSGPGSGSGTGMGIGSGDGSGIGPGKGPGYSSAKRNYVNIPDVNISENGVVYVEVHVTAQGNVINARILSTPKYKTTITNAKIQQECIARALSAKYASGKEELRIIEFK